MKKESQTIVVPGQSPIWRSIHGIEVRVDALEKRLSNTLAELATPPVTPPTQEPLKQEVPRYPIPTDFVEMVDLTLNKNFGIKYEPLPDSPSFQFTITVPEKYSPNKPTTDLRGQLVPVDDSRTKVISTSDGLNGVRMWAEKIYSTFDADTQFRIVEDRPFANRQI